MEKGHSPSKESQVENPSKERRSENSWIIGLTLLLIGTIFLLQNLTGLPIEKWWSVFLIIPAVASFVTAWRRSRAYRRLYRSEVLRPLGLGLLLIAIILVLLFKLTWQIILAIFFLVEGFISYFLSLVFSLSRACSGGNDPTERVHFFFEEKIFTSRSRLVVRR